MGMILTESQEKQLLLDHGRQQSLMTYRRFRGHFQCSGKKTNLTWPGLVCSGVVSHFIRYQTVDG